MISFVEYYSLILHEEKPVEQLTDYDLRSEYMGYKEACRLLGSFYDSPRYENSQHVYEVYSEST